MSDELKKFLTEWLEWAENDGTEGKFDPQFGLCYNYCQFCGGYNSNAYAELAKMFKVDGLDDAYPFDKDGDAYEQDAIFSEIHKNPERRAWVRSKLELA